MTANLDWCLARRIAGAHYDTRHSVTPCCEFCRFWGYPVKLCVYVAWDLFE